MNIHWDSFNVVVFIVSMAALTFYLFNKVSAMQSQSDEIGSALMAFGRAFPGVPVRDAQTTHDAGATFLRLSDGNTGYVQSFSRHVVCRILQPGAVRVQPGAGANVIHLEFGDSVLQDGEFYFRNASQAAEVSLWLLGSFVAEKDQAETSNTHQST